MAGTLHEIRKVAVIGAGVMGSGIAAHIANAGIDVLLLDIVPAGADNRNVIAEGALARLVKSKPAALMQAANGKRIQAGNLEDDLDKLRDCDWIVEAVVERLDVKQALFAKIQPQRKPGSIVSSNTSTLPLARLTDGQPEAFTKDFLITHFFNPPRYMRLLEIVTGPKTDPAQEQRLRAFADHKLGKSLVDCKDTPGFIANRIGTYWLHAAITTAVKQGIDIETADAVLGRPAGVPKTGVFGLVDLVGLDLMPHLHESLAAALAADDPFKTLGPMPALIKELIDGGYTGRKGKGGFYRLNDAGEKEVLNIQDKTYQQLRRPLPPAAKAAGKGGLRALFNHDSAAGRYAAEVLSGTFAYAASLVPEIADDLEAVDRAMRLGYNWKQGPFELMDELGADWFIDKLERDNRTVPNLLRLAEGRKFYRTKNGRLQYLSVKGDYQDVRRPQGVLLLEDIKRRSQRLFGNSQASVWDVGDGVACLEFHSKMNSLNPLIIGLLSKALTQLPKRQFKGLVIYNEGTNFSVGANLLMLLAAARLRLGFATNWILKQGQRTFQRMKYCAFPVVGAPSGMALGGGCEVLLHCAAITAHAETYMGLVETGVGIVPGWGGCKELLLRGKASKKLKLGPMPAVQHAFETIATAKVSTSALEAGDLLFLRETDTIVMNRDRLLASAKQRVLELADNYHPPQPIPLKLPGRTAAAAIDMAVQSFANRGIATPHDVSVSKQLATVLSGDGADLNEALDEDYILALERKALVSLSLTRQTRARISHMLFKGKPLRN